MDILLNNKTNRMKNLRLFFAVIVLLFLQMETFAQADLRWYEKAIFYQIYPPSFKDFDGDGIGDIKGIIEKLDYVQSIGINAIWFTPMFSSPFKDGGYDVSDYYSIDKRYGTNDDMVQLIAKAHEKGLKLCLDLVIGHTSNENPWFVESSKGTNLRYSDYYIWTPFVPNEVKGKPTVRGNDIMGEDKYVPFKSARGNYYIKNFYDIQPALNFGFANPNPDHPWEQSIDAPGPQAVQREMKNVISFWMDKGIDGFRVDLASSIVKNDPGKKATIKVWQGLNLWFREKYPQGILIAEWFNPKQSSEAGFNIDFMRGGSLVSNRQGGEFQPTICYFARDGKGQLKDWYDQFIAQYDATKGKSYISLPTGNHDNPRLNAGDRNTTDQLKVTMTFFLTMPGIPVIYYGDEIGMKFLTGLYNKEGSQGDSSKNRAGSRTPMQWDSTKNAGFSTSGFWNLYLPVDKDPDRPNVAKEEQDSNSLLNYTRKLIQLRKSSKALSADGDWQLLSDVNKPYPMVYNRSAGGESFCIILNPTDKNLTVDIPTLKNNKASLVLGKAKGGYYKIGSPYDRINIGAVSALVFKME